MYCYSEIWNNEYITVNAVNYVKNNAAPLLFVFIIPTLHGVLGPTRRLIRAGKILNIPTLPQREGSANGAKRLLREKTRNISFSPLFAAHQPWPS
ncbi:hypothetical protein CEXT_543951 [Caerostris extrusa]|uniref:Uncharacterized protein n=1 Tax=Caerostris extrusa TaxID=172846 RepID=A0AAV4SYV0_CAEEX|nr:hypothetical protein CEXT_543951 [Caerostris extrusa]